MANRKTVKVYRSNKSLEAQLLDANKTLFGKKYFFNIKGDSPIKQSFAFGEDFGAALIKKGADKISFDRNFFKYHGRVKSFAEGLRKAKVEF